MIPCHASHASPPLGKLPAHPAASPLFGLSLPQSILSLVCGVLLTLQQTKGNSLQQQRAALRLARARRAGGGCANTAVGRRCSNRMGRVARSKSQKFPFVRESGAKRCRFFGRGAYGSVAAAVWTYGVMMRATAAWQKMQHLVRAERAAARLIG